MDKQSFHSSTCEGELFFSEDGADVIVRGRVHDNIKGGVIHYLAAAPIGRNASFSGSGLPFANAEQAFHNTPNKGTLELKMNNTFEIVLAVPNSYYVGLGTVLVPPSLFLSYENGIETKKIKVKLCEPVPYRMLSYPMSETYARNGSRFYAGGFELPVRTQEQILLDSAYPSVEHKDFWGLKPRQ